MLRRAAAGVMSRLSFLEHHTLQPGGQGQAKPLCLRNPDYAKMRKKMDLAFPEQLETTKVDVACKIAFVFCYLLSL